jgi:hypothetical protein
VKNIASCFDSGRGTWRNLLLCCFVLSLGCAAPQQGWVFPVNLGDRAALVLDAAFARRGKAQATLPNGEHCDGAFNTVAGAVTYNDERPTIIDSEDSQLGLLMLTCPRQRFIRCEFSRSSAGTGYGKCKDGSGQLYSLGLSNSGDGTQPPRLSEIPKAQASR